MFCCKTEVTVKENDTHVSEMSPNFVVSKVSLRSNRVAEYKSLQHYSVHTVRFEGFQFPHDFHWRVTVQLPCICAKVLRLQF